MNIHRYKDIPIYSAIPYGEQIGTNHYQVYANLLGMKLNIHTRLELKNAIKNNSIADCFIVVDAEGNHITDFNISNTGYHKLKEIKKHGARATLFSKNNTTKCFKDGI
jgi:hypothetical protein